MYCLLARWFCFGQSNSAYHSLKDEDPSPAGQPMLSVQLHQTKRKNTRQCRSDTSNEIENGESLLNVIFEESALCSHLKRSFWRFLSYIEYTSKIASRHNQGSNQLPAHPKAHAFQPTRPSPGRIPFPVPVNKSESWC